MDIKEKIKQFLLDAIVSFIYWTLALTPCMLLIVKLSIEQYIAWVGMQLLLTPILGAIFSVIARRIEVKKE